MILPSLVLAAALNSFQERSALKEVLPNGATFYVQTQKGVGNFSIVLASVPAGEPETPETHGLRHLAEHFMAKGANKGIDALLEKDGMVLLAETTRDALTFQVTGPA